MNEQKRQRRDARPSHPARMHLTERDKEIIRAVAEYRVLRQDQLQILFFGSKSTAQYRLVRLYQHGFLARQFLPVLAGSSPTLYVVDKRGIELLRAEFGRESVGQGQVGADFLAHTLAINDVRIAVTLACQQMNLSAPVWSGEAEMKMRTERVDVRLASGKRLTLPLVPDSYFVIDTPRGAAHFFLELDRGTETTQRFATKILAYRAYVESGDYQQRYHTRSLRVLTVTSSAKRLANLKRAAEAANGGRLFWFTTLGEITGETVLSSPIWQVAGEAEPHVLIALS